MMHQPWLDPAVLDCLHQRFDGQGGLERSTQRPPDHSTGKCVQDHRQIYELKQQPNVGYISDPELADTTNTHRSGQVRIYRQLMI